MALPLSFFWSFIVRPLWGTGRAGDRLRTTLSILAVALGVGVIVAIQLANRSSIDSFESSLTEISGRTNLSILAPNGIDEQLLPQVAEMLGTETRISPVMESTAVVASTQEVLRVLGIDIVQDSLFRDISLAGASISQRAFLSLLSDPHSLVVGQDFARRYGLSAGSTIRLLLNDRADSYTVRGILAPEGPGKTLAGSIAVMDIAAAQLAFGRLGKLDRLDLIVPPEQLPAYQNKLAAELPSGWRVEKPEARAEQAGKMLRAFRWNLTALSYISLVVGAFFIYNTIAISVIRRRAEIGALRSLGATRGEVLRLFLGEALLLGFAGGLAGIGLGRALSGLALRAVSGTVNTLYLAAPPSPIHLTPGLVAGALAIGLLTAFFSALLPAMETTGILPAEALQHGAHEQHRRLALRALRRDGNNNSWLCFPRRTAAVCGAVCRCSDTSQRCSSL